MFYEHLNRPRLYCTYHCNSSPFQCHDVILMSLSVNSIRANVILFCKSVPKLNKVLLTYTYFLLTYYLRTYVLTYLLLTYVLTYLLNYLLTYLNNCLHVCGGLHFGALYEVVSDKMCEPTITQLTRIHLHKPPNATCSR